MAGRLERTLPLVCGCLLVASVARAQQFATDDAVLPPTGSFELEGWHGERSSWILPGVSITRWFELQAGVGWVEEDGAREPDYALEARFIPFPVGDRAWGLGLVAGLGLDRISQILGQGGIGGAFVTLPISAMPVKDRVYLHANLGWAWEAGDPEERGTELEDPRHRFSWGLRLDVLPFDRVVLIGELFGSSVEAPVWQAGVALVVIPEHVQLSASYGGSLLATGDGPGWVVGLIAVTPKLW